ncbi:helix-turn-helix domain-containing protein [Actinacidiphila acidipaludis]|uniref:Helix-turn-helix domain-containing protein n=1 Tax=Actinacidiphila acidipaludis TaxID=2873382 RepID=A0ABS7QAW7_9ACTN|nr:helix-turn-helix domain-containing protein [Streptomyces acidipaludis]MBY8880312.1 helix-turn-helix domain-containing protein [Streptomyces acidipaludis]
MMFRSGDLPAGERLAAAHDLFGSGALPMRLAARADREFEADVRHVDVTPLRVMEMVVTPAAVLRTPRLIRRGDPELVSVILPLDGDLVVAQAGREAGVGRRQVALYDSSRPFEMRFSGGRGRTRVVSAHASRALLPLPLSRLDGLLARPLPAGPGSGFGGLLAQLLTDVTGDAVPYRRSDLLRMGGIARDLMTAFIAHSMESEAAVPDDTHRTTLLLRIDSYIQQHLHDPSLTPAAVAAAHHISVSHLHRVFTSHGATVAERIRRQRLEHAHRDLADPALRQVPVHRIAARWGFTTHATFTRAFHAAYGTSPRDHRRQAVRAPGGEKAPGT